MSNHVSPEASLQGAPGHEKTVSMSDYMAVLIDNLPVAALCHGLRVRLADRRGADALSSRFAACVAGARLMPGEATFWREDLQITSVQPAADRLRSLELNRPLPARSVLRVVVLAFADGIVDLILIASRRFIDGPALRAVASELIGLNTGGGALLAVRRHGTPAVSASNGRNVSACEWGLGGQPAQTGCHTVIGTPWNRGISPWRLIEAACVVLARFAGQERIELGVIGQPDAALSEAAPAAQLIRADIDEASTYESLTQAVERCVSQEGGESCQDTRPALFGIVWDEALVGHEMQLEVRACLAPPFALTIEPRMDAGSVIGLVYTLDGNAFTPEMARVFDRALMHFCAELERGLANGRDPVLARIGMVDSASARHIAELGDGGALPNGFKPFRIEERIALFAQRQPDAGALAYEDRSLTYRELDDLATRIAGVLKECGVREGDRVGICLERSLELVPVMLAVFKAGAAYVPIDPAYPADRIAYTLEDARPSLVVATAATPQTQGMPTIELAALLERASSFEGAVAVPSRSASAAAYVIYTSGSTGRPKGVVVPHRNVAALVAATAEDFELSNCDTWTMFHSSAFDFSVWEIWGCLTTGGRLLVVPYWVSRSPDEFVQLLTRERVSVLSQTPSAFAQLIAAESRCDERLAVRMVVFGGEPLDARMLLRWFDRYPETACRLVNMFGITETTVHVSAETLTRAHALSSSRVVGPALPGWRLYVMDGSRNVLPPGVPGEIYVGGAGVADQYLNRPDLNEQRFLSDPFADGRMYRSGDRGRLLMDGRLEHLGRLDNQVKIRGFRIELDEIRAVLLECPSVRAAAVVVHYANASDAASARLDAYVVLDEGTVADVRAHAARQLPEHMVPSTVTALGSLPLTANGKLDSAKLPMPKLGVSVAREPVVEMAQPRQLGTLLETLRKIWSDELGVPVGSEENFFELGGNSLFAVRIATVMRELGLPALPMRELYLRQTLVGVVEYLEAQSSAEVSR